MQKGANYEKDVAAQLVALQVNTITKLTDQLTITRELQSATETGVLQADILLEETNQRLGHKQSKLKVLNKRPL